MTEPAQPNGTMNSVLDQNIRSLVERRRTEDRTRGVQERLVALVSRFAGSMTFVYLHLAILVAWVVLNLGLIPGVRPWDPSFVVLAMCASVEAIFLSTFVLINQNRMAEQSDRRAELDLQVNLLNEHETTRIIEMLSALTDRLGLSTPADGELPELAQNVDPQTVMDEIEKADRTKPTDG